MNKEKRRVLIFIVAYNAEKTLAEVLNRIPAAVFDYDYRILIIDDSSSDQTFARGLEYRRSHPDLNLEILFNPSNQGYGGNQKLGYQYAIDEGFEAVVLLHGDGQYAPEVLEDMFRPLLDGDADAVFGSRMAVRGDALRGGMPLYKYVGNRILTTFQNRVLDANLSEFHSGYRAYSVAALEQIPFQVNTNDFHFDTEIIIQLMLKGLRIMEIPIPTYYGDEICYVDGLKYAWEVAKATAQSRFHRAGILHKRAFDVDSGPTAYDLKLGYTSTHTLALDDVKDGSHVLDLGCGQGRLAIELKKKGCTIHGVDAAPLDEADALDRHTQLDLSRDAIEFPVDEYDVILLLDVIEHLQSPEAFLDGLREKLKSKGTTPVIISVPNVAFLPVRMRLLLGDFQYGKQGILDLTHCRLFTESSLTNTLLECGYEIESVQGVPAPYPKAIGDNFVSRAMLAVNRALLNVSRGMFAYQIYVRARPLPTVPDLLEETRRTSSRLERSDGAAIRDAANPNAK
jgi:glycosyltransferase involved in cell wall biosynthesis